MFYLLFVVQNDCSFFFYTVEISVLVVLIDKNVGCLHLFLKGRSLLKDIFVLGGNMGVEKFSVVRKLWSAWGYC